MHTHIHKHAYTQLAYYVNFRVGTVGLPDSNNFEIVTLSEDTSMPEEGAAIAKLKKASTSIMALTRISTEAKETQKRLEMEVDEIYNKYHNLWRSHSHKLMHNYQRTKVATNLELFLYGKA